MTSAKAASAKKAAIPATVNAGDVSTAPDDWEFETLVEESPTMVIFDTIGDVFIGQYIGIEHIDPANGKDEPFDRFTFRGRDGELYAVNQSYKLQTALEDVDKGTWIRITYTKDIPTSRNLQPMKDFRIDVRK